MLRPSTYDDAVYVNTVVEINVLHQRRHGNVAMVCSVNGF